MPALIAHYLFGEEIVSLMPQAMGDSRDEVDAFLLGNQGPDVFFFAYLNPLLHPIWGIGSKMHKDAPDKLIECMLGACSGLPERLQGIGRSYVAGLICHYVLDSNMHPFVYAQQYEICDAGIEGLGREDGSEVHAEIERELDMLTLTKLRDKSIGSVSPTFDSLSGSDLVLDVISSLYQQAIAKAYGVDGPRDGFSGSVRAYRLATKALYSPSGIKSAILGGIEKLFRRYSMIEAMSHSDKKVRSSAFANEGHREWVDPHTGDVGDEGYWDLFERSLSQSQEALGALIVDDSPRLLAMVSETDFDGRPVCASILSVDSASA